MNLSFLRNRTGVMFTLYLLVFTAVCVRMIPNYLNTRSEAVVIALLVTYLVLMVTERLVTARFPPYPNLYFLLQLVIIWVLLIIPALDTPLDYFTNLVIPISGQAMWNLSEKSGRRWVITFCLFCLAALQIPYPGLEGFTFAITYLAGIILVSLLVGMTRKADRARQETQELLAELQVANQKLQDYAVKVERLAAAEERNRLARELHDSVSQTIFSMTLTAQAARILAERDPGRIPAMLDHLQTLAQDSLTEMRSLIEHLRPQPLQDSGLIPALRSHLDERKLRDGLDVSLQINGEAAMPEEVEEGLFRIIQEALNNVVKHACTDKAMVSLTFEHGTAAIKVEDLGKGFDPAKLPSSSGHIGLSSMEERVKALGGTLTIDSTPGRGTILRADHIPLEGQSPPLAVPAAGEAELGKEGENGR